MLQALSVLLVYEAGAGKLRLVIIDGGEQAAQQPSGGIAHGDGDDLVAEPGHNKQVYLPEGHEGGQHDDHGRLGIAGTSQRAGVDLIEAAEDVERG